MKTENIFRKEVRNRIEKEKRICSGSKIFAPGWTLLKGRRKE
jgi:hypothetical protein